jgi:hypothetical protein
MENNHEQENSSHASWAKDQEAKIVLCSKRPLGPSANGSRFVATRASSSLFLYTKLAAVSFHGSHATFGWQGTIDPGAPIEKAIGDMLQKLAMVNKICYISAILE